MTIDERFPSDVEFLNDVRDFHRQFGLEYTGPPRALPAELHNFRLRFKLEELTEYETASWNEDLPAVLDALVDLLYVLMGTVHLHGFDPIFREAWKRVHDANLKKVRAGGVGSDRGGEFDVVKPEGWQPPDLTDLVKR